MSEAQEAPKTRKPRTKPDPTVTALTRVGKILSHLDAAQRQKILAFHATGA